MQVALFAAGLVGLVVGAELLVRGASKLALAWGISPLVVGLTVVAFGTSAPEMAVSVGAVLDGKTDLALGNAVGSNIFNVLFILGLAAVITPLSVNIQIIRSEAPILVGSAVLVLVLALDGHISMLDSAMLFGLLLAYTTLLILQSRALKSTCDYDSKLQPAEAGRWDSRPWVQGVLVVAGLALLVGGSTALVGASVAFAKALGISDVVIGLTIVAAGTSLPEVAASVMAAIKGERDIAVGNVVGSCVFNSFGVIGLAGLVATGTGMVGLVVPEAVRHFDLWVMLAAMVACLPVFLSGRQIARWEGALFLAYYAAYTGYLVLSAQHHAALPAFSSVMMGFVIPLTIVTLVVSALPKRH
jgi:cation:H+ antiporter